MTDYQIQHGFNPFRRFFARTLDLSIYAVFVSAFITLVLDLDTMDFSDFTSFALVTIPSFIIMLLIEPLLISKFGTTIGKGILGIKVLNIRGEKADFFSVMQRTFSAIMDGMGFQIPFYSIYTQYRCYKKLDELTPLSYDSNFSIEITDYYKLRAVFYIIAEGIIIMLYVLIASITLLPQKKGFLTTAEYLDNYKFYMQKNDSGIQDPTLLKGKLEIVEQDGVVTEVIIRHNITNYDIFDISYIQMISAVQAFDSDVNAFTAWYQPYANDIFIDRSFKIDYKDMKISARIHYTGLGYINSFFATKNILSNNSKYECEMIISKAE